MHKIRVAAFSLATLMIGLPATSAIVSPVDPRCISPETHRTYFYSLKDLDASCTFVQQVAAELTFAFLLPLEVTSPILMILLLVLGFRLIRKHRLVRSDYGTLELYVLLVLVLACCLAMLYTAGSFAIRYP